MSDRRINKVIPRQKSFMQPKVNPFIHKISPTFGQKVQVAIMSITVAPIRLILFGFSLILTWMLGYIFTLNMEVPIKKPVGKFRTALFEVLRIMGRVGLFFLGIQWISVRGKRATGKEAPLLVCAPHSSMFDIFVSFASKPFISSVSRYENYEAPLMGTLSLATLPILVSRNDPNSRQNTIAEIKRRANAQDKWPQIIIFPEGTCTNRKSLITFKSGAFIPGKPVQPVALEYLNDLDSFTWTMNGPGSMKLLWLTLCQFSVKVRITYLPVYSPNEEEKNDPKLFADNVKHLMAEVLEIPCTDHTFEDCRLMRHAIKLKLPMETGLIEFTKLSRKLGMNIDGVQDRLSEFSKIACDRSDGLISIEDFAKFLNMQITPALQEMFNLYDRNQSGFIDFREYVIGLSLVSQPSVTDDTVRLAFKVFDKDQDGIVSKEEFRQVLDTTFGSDVDVETIFGEMNKGHDDKVTYDEFYSFVEKRPEYAKMFVWYREMQQDITESDMNTASTSHANDTLTQRKGSNISPRAE